MSDLATEPQGAPLAETTSEPTPLTNQVPPKEEAPAAPKKPLSISDALKQAQAEVKAKDDTKAAPVKEEVKPEAKTEAKPPEVKTEAPAKAEAPKAEADTSTPAEIEARKTSPHREPPSRFDDAAKGEWERAPEAVKGAVHRTIREMEAGIQKHKQAAEEFESVREFADMAKQHGTDLKSALKNYVGIEQQLRQNPLQGLQQIVSNLGLKKPDGSPVTLRDIAGHVMGQAPDAVASQSEAQVMELRQQVQQLQEQLGGVQQHFQSQKTATVANEVEAFRSMPGHDRFDELQDDIAAYLRSGLSDANLAPKERLKEAYDYAAFKKPAAHTGHAPAAHTGDVVLPDQTRTPPPMQVKPAGQKSISGAPGNSTTTSGKPKVMSIKDSIAAAMRG